MWVNRFAWAMGRTIRSYTIQRLAFARKKSLVAAAFFITTPATNSNEQLTGIRSTGKRKMLEEEIWTALFSTLMRRKNWTPHLCEVQLFLT